MLNFGRECKNDATQFVFFDPIPYVMQKWLTSNVIGMCATNIRAVFEQKKYIDLTTSQKIIIKTKRKDYCFGWKACH